ncbi:MAG TPA: hypothetical protein VNR91_07435, partial [Sphingomonas sp.]|nr:hypothetical protein [Sphingomonas sp.]
DWSASYVATMGADGRTLDLFAWMTLANGNAETLPDAEVNAVAGRLERRFVERYRTAAGALRLECYPLGTTTSNLPSADAIAFSGNSIVVTARRRGLMEKMDMVAAPAPPPPPPPPPPEDLGDLKLYRVPMRVAVAANQQKQVALLRQAGVAFERLYVAQASPRNQAAMPVGIELRMKNEAGAGLGIALPAGTTALYQERDGERLLLGLGNANDTAVGQRFAIGAGTSRQVQITQSADRKAGARVTLTNANAAPVTVEVRVGAAGATNLKGFSAPVERIDGVWTWRVTVPANGTATLGYSYS